METELSCKLAEPKRLSISFCKSSLASVARMTVAAERKASSLFLFQALLQHGLEVMLLTLVVTSAKVL